MASSSSTTPASLPLQPSKGEGLETPSVVPAVSTEAMVDAAVAPPTIPGEATPTAPSFVSDETENLREGFVFSLIDPWYGRLEAAVDQGWVPNLDEISELLIQKGDLQDSLRDAGVHWSILISRSCNMFRDTEPLREVLRRWCPSTHIFFFSWGELTPTLEDVANHWMLPILGEHSLSNIKLSAEEEETVAALKRQSSTKLSGWPSFFIYHKEASVRRAAFVLYWLCKCTFGNFSCYSINTAYIPLTIRISTGHCFPFAPLFSGHLYSQSDLLHDCKVEGDSCYILFAAFNTSALQTFFWEHSVSYLFAAKDKSATWGRFSDLPREFLDRFPDFRNNLPLVYRWVGLKTRDYDLVDALNHEENVLFRPYGDDYPGFTCVSVFSRFYQPTSLIRDLKVDDYRSLTYLSTVNPGFLLVLSITGISFIPYCPQRVQRQFGLDQGVPVGPQETATCVADLTAFIKSRAFARWGGETNRSMVEFVNAGRSDKTPMSVHRKPLDGVRGGWIAYTIHLPESWRNSVNVVENRLIMPSKRGKGSKRDAPVDLAVEKTSKKPTPSIPSSKKAPSKKTKAGKKEPTESTVAPSKIKSMSASPSKKSGKKSVASRPPKGQEKTSVSSSSPDEEQPSAALTPLPSKKKKFVAPLFPLGAASRTRSKSGSKATHGSGRSGDGVIIVEDSDMVVDDVVASPLEGDDLQTTAVDQGKDLRKSVADSSEVGAESTGEGHSSSSDSLFDSVPGSVPEEQIISVGSTADDDNMPGADDSSMGPAGSMGDDLAIVPHASHGRDDDSAMGADVDLISFSVPQTVLISRVTGSDASMTYIMEGISLFGATPSFRAIPVGEFVISASRIAGEAPPVAGGAFIPEEIHAQGFVESESVVDLGVIPKASNNVDSIADHGAQAEDAGVFAVDTLVGSNHLENIGMDDTVRMSEDASEVGITGEITTVSPPPRPTAEAGSSVGASSLSSEVADFLKEFDRKTPNPHPEQFFWCFNGPLVPFGSFWFPNDCLPYLLRLSARRSDFTTNFKLSAGLGGPMLSLLGSVLATMSESSLEDVTKTQILAWRSVIQDLMGVRFDLGFMIERLQQTAQCFFGKRISDEVKELQHQIALLQDSLAMLTAYQDEMVSTGKMILGSERGGSFLDNLLD
uniref:Aminotransferase-like plant mobile domain-containing protein n=1 Tax=Fagus sylvatica TaxID=28930 RepID=A0A2N9F5W0_FAGSY